MTAIPELPGLNPWPQTKNVTVTCPYCDGTGKMPAQTMGQRIRALRVSMGLTPQELSERVGGAISAGNLQLVETDKNQNPKLEALRALAKLFRVSPGYLLDGDVT